MHGLPGRRPLAPLDYEIARLAAAGMTNKQIGERLYVSHRTVAAHLYQIFPRLGITSRAALRDALDALRQPNTGPAIRQETEEISRPRSSCRGSRAGSWPGRCTRAIGSPAKS